MGGPAGWQLMHSFRRDSSVTERRLPPGTIRRIARFASPYKRQLGWFLLLVMVDAVIGAAQPWIYKAIIENGIQEHRRDLVVGLALLIAGLALLAAIVNLANRWFSAQIGEGLIYDMRSAVFSHIQRMPLAFFTRTQTGALISRINNDVLGAQQAFTGTLSNVVSNIISVTLVLIAMLLLSWQITLLALLMVPLFIIPARLMARRLQSLTREAYAINASMSTTMTEKFNVSGAMLVKLFGRPQDEDTMFRTKARRVADIGVQQAMFARILFVCFTLVAALGTALVYGMGGYQAAADPAVREGLNHDVHEGRAAAGEGASHFAGARSLTLGVRLQQLSETGRHGLTTNIRHPLARPPVRIHGRLPLGRNRHRIADNSHVTSR